MNITIPDVPEEVRDVPAARAQRSGRSLPDLLRQALIDLADDIDQVELWEGIEERVKSAGTTSTADEILDAIHDGGR